MPSKHNNLVSSEKIFLATFKQAKIILEFLLKLQQ